jgi:Uma2 family endonuclease
MFVSERLISTSEFEDFIHLPENDGRLFELVNGEIVEKMPTREHGMIGFNIAGEFFIYFRKNPVGQGAVEARHRPTDDEQNDRIPDISIVLGNKPVERDGVTNYLPDIVIEIQSPRDSWQSMIDKALFYLDHGTRVVLLVYTRQRQIEKLTQDERLVLNEEDTLDLSEILPGLSIAVEDVFRGV